MRRIDFVTLRLFVAIAETRSLTRAAEREHLALAAVSKRVSDLEGQLDVSLLYRQPGRRADAGRPRAAAPRAQPAGQPAAAGR